MYIYAFYVHIRFQTAPCSKPHNPRLLWGGAPIDRTVPYKTQLASSMHVYLLHITCVILLTIYK